MPGSRAASGDNSRGAASRSAEEICSLADPLGVRLALEVIPNDLSSAQAVVTMHCAGNRKESRGAHMHEDFPERDDGQWMKHSAAWFDGWGGEGGGVRIDYRPVHQFTLTSEARYIEPKARVY